jgi:two-component system chemotaxis response regulator CheB
MTAKRIVVIGTSAGGLEALRVVAAGLAGDFAAAVCVVLHTAADAPAILAGILSRAGPLPAVSAMTGMRLEDRRIFVAPPDSHLIVEPGSLRTSKGPKENRFRPAIDPLFRSAAQVYGPAAIGVVMTGDLDDGTAGLWALKRLGGVAIVQDPADALFPSMPASAARHVDVDYCVSLSEIAPLLVRLVATPVPEQKRIAVPHDLDVEIRIAREEHPFYAGIEGIGDPSPFSCPECHGVLLRLKEAYPARYRCHTGHAFSLDSLVSAMRQGIEDALWIAVRALDEGALLLQHLSQHLGDDAKASAREALTAQAVEARRQSDTVRQVMAAREALGAAKS